MEDEAHVRLVDAHAEGDRRADDDAVVLQKFVLVFRAHLMIEAGVIGQRAPALAREFLGQFLGALARGAIDDAALALMRLQPVGRAGASHWPSGAWRGTGSAGRKSARKRAAGVRTAARRCRRASARRRWRSPRSSARRRAPRRPRAGAYIRGGNHGPIARRNGPRRWRTGRSWRSAATPSCRRAPAARARHRAGAASDRARRSTMRWRSSASDAEFSAAADTPSSRNCATWSRISAISGETTSVRPSRAIAGNW